MMYDGKLWFVKIGILEVIQKWCITKSGFWQTVIVIFFSLFYI